MKQSVVLLGKGTLAIRIANWFLNHPDYELRMVVPVIPEPAWTESLSRWSRTLIIITRADPLSLSPPGQANRSSWW